MPEFKTLMDIFRLLEKTNCRKCDAKTCLAFAAAVFSGDRPLSDCPHVPPEILGMYGGVQPKKPTDNELEIERQIAKMRARLARIDYAEAARRIGGAYDGKRLVIKIMGRDVGLDAEGKIYTDIHVHPWITVPILNYVLDCKGAPVRGQWVPLRELPGGQDWYRLFGQRCEKPMKQVADTYADLFADLVDIFNGRPVDGHYQSDVALVLNPLPLVPLLICYWRAEEGMESTLNLFFDASAGDNLGIEGIYALAAGITRMFEKLASRHGGSQG
jgi:hypothetical protein